MIPKKQEREIITMRILEVESKIIHKTIPVNGVNIHFVEAGPKSGPLLLFLHGFPEFWISWRKQIDYFAGAGYRVIVPDQRGCGESSRPKRVRDYNLDLLTGDMIGLLDHLDAPKAFLVCHDWGAMVGWHLGIKYPERFEKMVIMNCPHPLAFIKQLLRPWQLLRSWYAIFFQLPFISEFLVSRNRFWAMRKALKLSSREGTFSPEQMELYLETWKDRKGFRASILWYRAFIRSWPKKPESYRVKIPTLILWGAEDAFLRLDTARESLKFLDQGEFKVFEDTSHWIQHERPDDVNYELERFFKA